MSFLLLLFSQFAEAPRALPEPGLADSLFARQAFYDAATEYERCLFAHRAESLPTGIRHRLVRAYARSGELNRARLLLDALPADTFLARTRYELALGYFEHSRPIQARIELNDLLAATDDTLLRQQARRLLAWIDVEEGDFARAGHDFLNAGDSTLAGEASRWANPPRRNPELAVLMSSILPGTGELYAGNLKYGVLSLLVNGATVTGTVYSLTRRNYMDAALLFSLFFVRFYFGSRSNARDFADDFNRLQTLKAAEHLRQQAAPGQKPRGRSY